VLPLGGGGLRRKSIFNVKFVWKTCFLSCILSSLLLASITIENPNARKIRVDLSIWQHYSSPKKSTIQHISVSLKEERKLFITRM
jgi:hypothetical protein